MTRDEFLTTLRGHISGKIPSHEVEADIAFYETYIDEQLKDGQSEEQIMEALGSPLLIARTLVDSSKRIAENNGYSSSYKRSSDSYEYDNGSKAGAGNGGQSRSRGGFERYDAGAGNAYGGGAAGEGYGGGAGYGGYGENYGGGSGSYDNSHKESRSPLRGNVSPGRIIAIVAIVLIVIMFILGGVGSIGIFYLLIRFVPVILIILFFTGLGKRNRR